MSRILTTVRRFVTTEDGNSMVEYAGLIALLALACVGAMQSLGTSLGGFLNYVGSQLNSSSGS